MAGSDTLTSHEGDGGEVETAPLVEGGAHRVEVGEEQARGDRAGRIRPFLWLKPLGGNLLQVTPSPLKPLLQFLNHVIDVPVLKDAPSRLGEELGNLRQLATVGQQGTSLEKEADFCF